MATLVTWHGLQVAAEAAAPPKAGVILKMVITIPDGETLPYPFNPVLPYPNGPKDSWIQVLDSAVLSSGQDLTDWEYTFTAGVHIVQGDDGIYRVQGRAEITCERKIVNH